MIYVIERRELEAVGTIKDLLEALFSSISPLNMVCENMGALSLTSKIFTVNMSGLSTSCPRAFRARHVI